MTLTPLNKQLNDLGGFPVLWDSDLGTLVQDPTMGGTNAYGPGDLFKDANNGDLYQLGPGGALNFVRAGSQPLVAGSPMGTAAPLPAILGGTSGNAQPARTTGGGLDVQSQRAAQGTASAVGSFFSQNLTLGTGFSIPYWLLAGAGVLVFAQQRRRRGR